MAETPKIMFTDPPAGVGKETFRNVVSAAHLAYQLRKRTKPGDDSLPTVEDIAAYTSVRAPVISKILATDEFLRAMRERGIYWSLKSGLTPEQTYALGIITNPADKSDLNGKLRKAGISYQVYRTWLKQPLFAQAIRQIGEEMLGDHISDVHTALMSQAVNGNMKAIELYYQMTGRFDPAKQTVQDLQRMVNLLMETIFRYVTDTATLRRITEDFEAVMSGKIPEATIYVEGQVINDGPPSAIRPLPVAGDDLGIHSGNVSGADSQGEEVNGEGNSAVASVSSGVSSGGVAGDIPHVVSGAVVENFNEALDSDIPPGFFDFQETVSFDLNKDN